MRKKEFTAIGLMTGTSMDGVDLSLIKSDGYTQFVTIFNDYCEFDKELQTKLIDLRDKLFTFNDIKKFSRELSIIERDFTIFHAKIIDNLPKEHKDKAEIIGFHGQTIFHDSKIQISKQIGDGRLLSQITKKLVVNDFRKQDLQNSGQGAPLTPIFHKLISSYIKKKNNLAYPLNIINIGGITNITQIIDGQNLENFNFYAKDIGPGNCLIDEWVRKNSKKNFDNNGDIARSGRVNNQTFNQAIENFNNYSYKDSLDVKDFGCSFVKGLSFEDGCATLTKFSAYLIAKGIDYINNLNKELPINNLICGGGRKNSFLIENIKDNLLNKEIKLENIDKYGLDGDFIESQSFGYLAIRTYLGLPISFPSTTGCNQPTIGGTINKNF